MLHLEEYKQTEADLTNTHYPAAEKPSWSKDCLWHSTQQQQLNKSTTGEIEDNY